MLGFPPVVQATVDGHRVVAVRCSQVRGCPWLTIDIEKGWTVARADDELEEKVALSAVVASAKPEPVPVKFSYEVGTGGRSPAWVQRMVDEMLGAKAPKAAPSRWRIESALLDGESLEGSAADVWSQLALAIDGGWAVDAIEQLVDGTWRRRSVRDLLEAAGGDPL